MLCALPFFYIAWEGLQKNAAPIAFWAGDDTLKDKLADIPAYNAEMARLYRRYGASFALYGLLFLINSPIGIIAVCLECTVGLYLLFRSYQSILLRHSRSNPR